MFRVLIFLGVLLVFATAHSQPELEGNYESFSIYFEGGSYYIDELQQAELYEFLAKFKELEHFTITIHSHTDNIGGAAFNEWLSNMRSESTIRLLLEKEIPQEMISRKDFGQFNPVYDNSTWYGRRMNRRVDIIFWPVVM